MPFSKLPLPVFQLLIVHGNAFAEVTLKSPSKVPLLSSTWQHRAAVHMKPSEVYGPVRKGRGGEDMCWGGFSGLKLQGIRRAEPQILQSYLGTHTTK